MTNLIRWANIILIFVTFVSYLSPFVNPATFWPFSFFGLAYPWLLLANTLFIVFWIVLKKWYFLLSFCCILAGWNHFLNFIAFNTSSPSHSESIQVGSYNLKGLVNIKWQKDKKASMEADLLKLIKGNEGIDIICTQESSMANLQFLSKGLKLNHVYRAQNRSAAILSRFPMVDKGEIIFKNSKNATAWVDLDVNGKTIRVYSLHLQSTKVAPATDDLLENGDLKEKETWLNIKEILARVKRASITRTNQAKLVTKHMDNCRHPIILCGDFNDTPLSFVYKMLSEKLKDAFQEKGFGIGSTYAGNIPALRIDYIFTDKRMEIINYKTLRDGDFSDHYAIKSEIVLP